MGQRSLWVRRSAIAAVAVLSMLPWLISPAAAKPAIWEVRDEDSLMHLFGTVHVLRPETAWMSDILADALAGAEQVWFEVDPHRQKDPVLMGRVMPLMLDLERPLSTKLNAALHDRFSEIARSFGAHPDQFEMFRPAPAAAMLASIALTRAGYSPDSGVDKVLRAMVPDADVRELETIEQQIRSVCDMTTDQQVRMLEAALNDIADLDRLDRVVARWEAGDIPELEAILLDDILNHRDFYDRFVLSRNLAWAEILADELAGAGTGFVAVGALHLVGPDGLPKLLADRGYSVEQIQ